MKWKKLSSSLLSSSSLTEDGIHFDRSQCSKTLWALWSLWGEYQPSWPNRLQIFSLKLFWSTILITHSVLNIEKGAFNKRIRCTKIQFLAYYELIVNFCSRAYRAYSLIKWVSDFYLLVLVSVSSKFMLMTELHTKNSCSLQNRSKLTWKVTPFQGSG